MKYGLNFVHKNDEIHVRNLVNHLPILKQKELNLLNDNKNYFNYLIKGDNLYALTSLYMLEQKVDVIYIDPPYNTGKEFVYNDKIVDENDAFSDTKWLNFMQKRLLIARELLKEDGVIFISINDFEFAQLKLLCDEIFGKKNFICNFIWNMYAGVHNDADNISKNTEYVLCYAKDITSSKHLFDNEDYDKSLKYKFDDNDGLGKYALCSIHAKGSSKTDYTYTFKNGVVWKAPHGRHTSYSFAHLQELEAQNKIVFNKNNTPLVKKYLNKVKQGRKMSTLLNAADVGYTTNGTQELKKLLGAELGTKFENPKPPALIKKLLSLFKSRKNITVLDFFAGSGTTGQAVLELNQEQGTNFKFILITNNDNGIFDDITLPRIKAVIKRDNLQDNIITFTTELIPLTTKAETFFNLKPYFIDLAKIQFGTFKQLDLNNDNLQLLTHGDTFVFISTNRVLLKDIDVLTTFYTNNHLENSKVYFVGLNNKWMTKKLKSFNNITYIQYPNGLFKKYTFVKKLVTKSK